LPILSLLCKIPGESAAKSKDNNYYKKSYGNHLFTGTILPGLDVPFREQKSSQDHFLAIIAPELSKENPTAKRRVRKNQLVVHMDNSVCHHGGKIREYSARKTIMKVRHLVPSPDLSPCDFWFFDDAWERTKDQIITSQDDLEDKLTEVWETVKGDFFHSVFSE
jgi:hypothetical protein